MSADTHHAEQRPLLHTRRAIVSLILTTPLVGLVAAVTRSHGLVARGSASDEQAATPALEATPCAGPATPLSSASPVGSPAPAPIVKMTNQLRFEPDHLAIRVGETVTWVNDSVLPHTATGDPAQNPVATSHPEYVQLPDGAAPWGSALLQPGESFQHTFDSPGEYHYICIPHVLSGMRGTITVTC